MYMTYMHACIHAKMHRCIKACIHAYMYCILHTLYPALHTHTDTWRHRLDVDTQEMISLHQRHIHRDLSYNVLSRGAGF